MLHRVERPAHGQLAALDEVLDAHAVAQLALVLALALVAIVLMASGLLDLALRGRDEGVGPAQVVAQGVQQVVEFIGLRLGRWW